MESTTQAKEWYADGLRFTCHQCGNCCSGPTGFVWFTPEEALAIANHLKIGVGDFLADYAHDAYGDWSLSEVDSEHGKDCVFLRRDETGKALCSIYPVRPKQCRTWPFWPENLKSERAWKQAGARCQGMIQGMRGQGAFVPVELIRIVRDHQAKED